MHMYLYVWHSVRMNHKNDRTVRLNLECWKPVRLRTTKWKPIPRKLSLNVEITLFDRCFFVLLCFALLFCCDLWWSVFRLQFDFFPFCLACLNLSHRHTANINWVCVYEKRESRSKYHHFVICPSTKKQQKKTSNNSTYKIYSWNRLMQKRRWKADHLAACTPIHTNTQIHDTQMSHKRTEMYIYVNPQSDRLQRLWFDSHCGFSIFDT